MRLGNRNLLVAMLAGVLVAGPAQAIDLLGIYREARAADTDFLSARAEAGAAAARYREARGGLLPQLSGTANISKVQRKQRFSGIGNGLAGALGGSNDNHFNQERGYSLSLNLPLFDWSAWQAKNAAASRQRAAAAQLDAAGQQLMVDAAKRYFAVLAARDALQAVRQRQGVIARQLKRAKARYQAGVGPITDQQEAQSQLDGARVDGIDARHKFNRARVALGQLTGQTVAGLAGLASTGNPAPAPARDVSVWTAKALARSPRVAAARAAYVAAGHDVGRRRGGHLPTLALVGQLARARQVEHFPVLGSDTAFNSISRTTSIGLQVKVPLFSGGTTTAAVAEAQYNREKARENLIAARRKILLNVRGAYDDVTAATARVTALRAAIGSGKTAVAAAKIGVETSTRNILDVLQAEQELVKRREEFKQAWYDYFTAKLKLRRAGGTLGLGALRRVNAHLQGKAGTAAQAPGR